jgi:hypothetical protein
MPDIWKRKNLDQFQTMSVKFLHWFKTIGMGVMPQSKWQATKVRQTEPGNIDHSIHINRRMQSALMVVSYDVAHSCNEVTSQTLDIGSLLHVHMLYRCTVFPLLLMAA